MKLLNFNFYEAVILRYGENPHQKAWVWQEKTKDKLALYKFKQLQGKQLSFNNYLDIDAAVNSICFIGIKGPACVIIKHTNPCGASFDKDINKAFNKAWEGDSLAAFGSIIVVNRSVDEKLANLMIKDKKFFEVLLCPYINSEAKKILGIKKNLRILINPVLKKPLLASGREFRKIRGGVLVQQADTLMLTTTNLKTVTDKKPTPAQIKDLLFAWNICRVSKSNTIVLVKNQQLIGSGVGQQDRFRCCELAVSKAGKRALGSVAASDAFFPFKDGPEILIKAGVKAIIQPGGSIKDQETIDLCNKHNIAMVYTGIRGFKH